jgi:glycosyltransferase involved in cell wall biosynthesis
MRMLVDGQALQANRRPCSIRFLCDLLQALVRCRRDWDWTLIQSTHLPPIGIDFPVDVRRATFQPTCRVRPFDGKDGPVNERYYGDWLMAQDADGIILLDWFNPKLILPHYHGCSSYLIGVLPEFTPPSPAESSLRSREMEQWYETRLRALGSLNLLVATSPVIQGELRELIAALPVRIVVADPGTCHAEEVCTAITEGKRPMPQAAKRIAWVSPMPPTPSGISDYSGDLLPALSRHYDIDWIIDPQQTQFDPALTRKYRTLTASEAIARHRVKPYDLFVYHLGNSGCHVYMLELLRRFRGLIVLHDFHLGGLVATSRQRGLWPTTIEEELEFEGEAHLLEWKRKGYVTEEVLRQLVPENTRLLSLADAVLVHSAWTWQRVRRLVDVAVARVGHMMPLTPQVSKAVRRRELGLPETAFVVCSLGHHGHTKRMHSLLRAVADVHESLRRRVQIAIVGPMRPPDQELLRQLALELGMAGQLRLTGFVGMAEFNAYIQAADVCVQLRYPTNGETSGSVLRAMAAGTPVITSDQGPMAELPDDAVCKVRTPQFEGRDLTALLEQLDADPERREALGAAGRKFVAEQLDPATIAAGYMAIIEQTISRRKASDADWQEAIASVLSDSTLGAGPERDQLLEQWAALRLRGLLKRNDLAEVEIPTRKAG